MSKRPSAPLDTNIVFRLGRLAETSWIARTTARILILAGVLALWQALPKSAVFWVSSPALICQRLVLWMWDGTVWFHVSSTLATMLLGYTIGCVAGVTIGMILAFLPRVYAVVYPYIAALYALPKVALIPLYIILFGVGLGTTVAVVASAIFFQIFSNTLDGVRNTDPALIKAIRLMGGSSVEVSHKVLLPSALPWIFNGMKISVRDAIIYTIVAELFASSRGLGYLVLLYSNSFDYTGAFASIAILICLSLVVNGIVLRVEALGAASLGRPKRAAR